MPCSYSYLQENFNNRFYGAVSITVVLRETDNKVKGSSPSKTFFIFLYFHFYLFIIFFFLLSQICRKFFVIYVFAEKSMFDVLCTCKATSLSKMAKLTSMWIQRRCKSYYWKCLQVLHGGKEVWKETVTESCMEQDCSTHWRKPIYRSENCGREEEGTGGAATTKATTVTYVESVTG